MMFEDEVAKKSTGRVDLNNFDVRPVGHRGLARRNEIVDVEGKNARKPFDWTGTLDFNATRTCCSQTW